MHTFITLGFMLQGALSHAVSRVFRGVPEHEVKVQCLSFQLWSSALEFTIKESRDLAGWKLNPLSDPPQVKSFKWTCMPCTQLMLKHCIQINLSLCVLSQIHLLPHSQAVEMMIFTADCEEAFGNFKAVVEVKQCVTGQFEPVLCCFDVF